MRNISCWCPPVPAHCAGDRRVDGCGPAPEDINQGEQTRRHGDSYTRYLKISRYGACSHTRYLDISRYGACSYTRYLEISRYGACSYTRYL